MAKTLVFIPTYNEAGNVGLMHSQIKALGLDVDILFCDDASPDGTGQIIDRLAKADGAVRAIHRGGKLGIGSAHQAGIAFAYAHGYTVLITMDCDFSHPPAYIKDLLGMAEEADIVIGSRYMKKDSLKGWGAYRKTMSLLGHFFTAALMRMPYDASNAFRLYRLDRIPARCFSLVRSGGYAFFFESLYVFMANGIKIAEVPIHLPPRLHGHSKMTNMSFVKNIGIFISLLGRRAIDPGSFK